MPPSAPEPLAPHHRLDDFCCGVATLDDWLKKRARANQVNGASRTYVTHDDGAVVGYYSIASSSITVTEAAGKFKRNMPDPIPVVVLGRLAISDTHQGKGIGKALMRDAIARITAAGDEIGIRGVDVHAINQSAKDFYLSLGFRQSPTHEMTLMITMNDLKATI